MTTTELKEKAAGLKERTTELKERTVDFMLGDLSLTKLDFLLIGAICLLAGICIGLLTAPFTHGISIASNNGNNNGNNCGNINDKERCNLDETDDSHI
ncbi:MAG: hypothetical protein K2J99_10980 [Lachnospiraceae bacterium]|nr:hypothetical protein [Lachnospiraceae bacterium]